ncbi:glycosyltransferase family 2 protein [Porphyromonas somerae]|uniref:glycosyltransferase family 2 protein n=1 Tax=Porphyromonas somerae TaxID=322095 RepID=UPI001FCA667B|nr:glycosyltransferase family 2 protein [Porphyromonas somerae]BDE81575.1 glycosyl transferase [Porphyromonas somerae]
MPKISVIIPVYNVEKYLRRCLDSVLAQTFTDWEAVCVNDGSPDNSQSILEEYASRDSRFKIVVKENGGLSDARNVGMQNAQGEYINYLDSDDLIHPQTFELALALMKREKAEVVTWYKDPYFRPYLLVRHFLGFNIDNAVPKGLKKRYDLKEIKSYTTDNVFEHITEKSHTNIENPIKHFYVWRHLIKKELIEDIPFLKGVIFEDFPWWSEVVLKEPRTVITNLPFYYYFPNIGSIDRSSTHCKKVRNWIIGLEHTDDLYKSKASSYQQSKWSAECKWPVIKGQILSKLKGKKMNLEDRKALAIELLRLKEKGVFDNPPTEKEVKTQRTLFQLLDELAPNK